MARPFRYFDGRRRLGALAYTDPNAEPETAMSEHHDALLFEDAAHRAVEAGGAVGLVAAATAPDAPLIEIACGWSDAARTRPMAMDTVFAFASMTKTVTAVAALQLVEEGAIGLEDPVGRWVPHFA